MIGSLLTQPERVALDRRVSEEGMTILDPLFERPDWYWTVMGGGYLPYAIVMDSAGLVDPRRQLIDEVDWHRCTAIRLETACGAPFDPTDFDDDGEWE